MGTTAGGIAKLSLALVMLTAVATAGASTPRLAIVGTPYFDGAVTIHVLEDVPTGAPCLLVAGLGPLPLDAPLTTGKGDWYIGQTLLTIALPPVPVGGDLAIPAPMPAFDPQLVGLVLVLQAFDGVLSNPATLPIDVPHAIPADALELTQPVPSLQAQFGDRLATGDLNDDGIVDLVISAIREDVGGFDFAGRVYVAWGPAFSQLATLEDALSPGEAHFFGGGLAVADFDGDGVDDLVVAETAGTGVGPTDVGYFHMYFGGDAFSTTPSMIVPTIAQGLEATNHGRSMTHGDFDGDGTPDIAASVGKATVAGVAKAGRIDVYLGPDLGKVISIENPQPTPDTQFGSRIVAARIDGDGIDDLVEVSPGVDGLAVNEGGGHIILGGTFTIAATIESPLAGVANALFGDGLTAGDLDGDGDDEFVISSWLEDAHVFDDPLFRGEPILRIRKPPTAFGSPFGEPIFGLTMDIADVNADGLADILISDAFAGELGGCAPFSSGGTLFVSLAPYFATFHAVIAPTPACGDQFALAHAAMELDGDAGMEIVSASPTADEPGALNNGRVAIYDLD